MTQLAPVRPFFLSMNLISGSLPLNKRKSSSGATVFPLEYIYFLALFAVSLSNMLPVSLKAANTSASKTLYFKNHCCTTKILTG